MLISFLFISLFLNYVFLRIIWFKNNYFKYISVLTLYISDNKMDSKEDIEKYIQTWPYYYIIFSFKWNIGNFFYYKELYNQIADYSSKLNFDNENKNN